MESNSDSTTEVLHALAQPHRREILQLLASGELPAGEIAGAFDVTRPAVSQHLRVLRDAGLVLERRDGTRRLYRINTETLRALQQDLEQLWGGALRRARDLVIGDVEVERSEAG